MTEGVRLKGLLTELRSQLGSYRRLADRLGVTEKTVRDWLSKSEDDLRRLHPDNRDQILGIAGDLGLELERFSLGPSLWEPHRSYDENLSSNVPPPPRPLRPFQNHSIDFLGFRVNSPVGIAAGALTDFTATPSRCKFFLDSGADVVTAKTVRSSEVPAELPSFTWFCPPDQPIIESPIRGTPEVEVTTSTNPSQAMYGIVGSFRRRSYPPDVWLANFRAARESQRSGQLVILSVTGTGGKSVSAQAYLNDWTRVCELAVGAGATVIELDSTAPYVTNSGSQPEPFRQPALMAKICKAVRQVAPKVKILLKIGYVADEDLREIVLQTAGAGLCDGFTAINAPVVRPFHRAPQGDKTYLSASTPLYLSGRPILGLGLQCVQAIARIRDEEGLKGMGIIATGGVSTEQDFLAYIHSGADVVQVASALYYDSHIPFKLRKFYDAQAQRADRVSEEETDLALASFAKAARELEKSLAANSARSERIMLAAQEEMIDWLRRKDKTAALGPLRPRLSPSVDESARLIQQRLSKPAPKQLRSGRARAGLRKGPRR